MSAAVEMARKPCTLSPNHKRQTPKAICTVLVPAIAATIIARRIRSTLIGRGCGSYLFVDDTRRAFVVSGDNITGEVWASKHFAWLVGFYRIGAGRNNGMEPTVEGLTEDIEDHIAGFVSAADGRECVGLQQTGEANSLQSTTGVAALRRSESGLAGEGDNSSPGGGQS